jgi:hypothetical protein
MRMKIRRTTKPPVILEPPYDNLPFPQPPPIRKTGLPKPEDIKRPVNEHLLKLIEELKKPLLEATEKQVAEIREYIVKTKSPYLIAIKLAGEETTEILSSIFETKVDVTHITTRLYAVAQDAINLQSVEFVATSLGLSEKEKRLLHLLYMSKSMTKGSPNEDLLSELLKSIIVSGSKERS